MRRGLRQSLAGCGVVLVSLVLLGVAAVRAQTPAARAPATASSATAPVRQLAYLKSSNPEAGDHFGCGGVLDGHAGYGTGHEF